MAYKLKVAGRTTGVSDNKTGLSIGLRLPFGEDGKVSECVTDASFLVQGEVWLTLEKTLPGEDGKPGEVLRSARMPAATGRLSVGVENVSFRAAVADGTEPSALGAFKFSDVIVVIEPRSAG